MHMRTCTCTCTCNMYMCTSHATCNMHMHIQHATCNMQHATCNMHMHMHMCSAHALRTQVMEEIYPSIPLHTALDQQAAPPRAATRRHPPPPAAATCRRCRCRHLQRDAARPTPCDMHGPRNSRAPPVPRTTCTAQRLYPTAQPEQHAAYTCICMCIHLYIRTHAHAHYMCMHMHMRICICMCLHRQSSSPGGAA